jgi:hypothetical protein
MILWADERYILGEDVSFVNLSWVYDGLQESCSNCVKIYILLLMCMY